MIPGRARGVITFPAQCILIASMNPCPCGRGKDNGCTCQRNVLENYKRKMSGPITDRLDIWLNVNKIDYDKLSQKISNEENSLTIRKRIEIARKIQEKRFAKYKIKKLFNGEMNAEDIEKCVVMSDEARDTLRVFAKKFELSGRAFHRIIKVARTIADLAGLEEIGKNHILEAIQYRQKVE